MKYLKGSWDLARLTVLKQQLKQNPKPFIRKIILKEIFDIKGK